MNKQYRYLSLALLVNVYFQAQGMDNQLKCELLKYEKETLTSLVQDGQDILGQDAIQIEDVDRLTYAYNAAFILEVDGQPNQREITTRQQLFGALVKKLGKDAALRKVNFLDGSENEDDTDATFMSFAKRIALRKNQIEQQKKREGKLQEQLSGLENQEATKRKEIGKYLAAYNALVEKSQDKIDTRDAQIEALEKQIEQLNSEITEIEDDCVAKFDGCDTEINKTKEERAALHITHKKVSLLIQSNQEAQKLAGKDTLKLRAYLDALLEKHAARKQELEEMDFTPISELQKDIKESSPVVDKEKDAIRKTNMANGLSIKQTRLNKLTEAQKELEQAKLTILHLKVAQAKGDDTYSTVKYTMGYYN